MPSPGQLSLWVLILAAIAALVQVVVSVMQ